jgi:hypothetical protein
MYTHRLLLDTPRVHIVGESVSPDILDRFVRMFAGTWRRLPVDVRASITSLWQPCADMMAVFAPVRLIGVDWPVSSRSSGFVADHGMEVSFRGQYFARGFPPYAAETIAHELAHVYQLATGRYYALRDIEGDVERLLQQWQFWCGSHQRSSRAYAANAYAAALDAY